MLSIESRGKERVEFENEVREKTTKVDSVGLARAREVRHPAQGGGIVGFQEEYPSILVGDEGMSVIVVVFEGEHHEESIDNDSYELVDVDVPCWCRDRLIFPGWETAKDFVRETPLKEESKGETSHGDVTSI